MLITNVGIGPGPVIVAELTRRGARVAIQHANDDKVANETATKISGLTGSEPAIVQADLRHVSECDRAVEEAAEALDGLDLEPVAGVARRLEKSTRLVAESIDLLALRPREGVSKNGFHLSEWKVIYRKLESFKEKD